MNTYHVRKWRAMADGRKLGWPRGFAELEERMQLNLFRYFYNYCIACAGVACVSLVFHPMRALWCGAVLQLATLASRVPEAAWGTRWGHVDQAHRVVGGAVACALLLFCATDVGIPLAKHALLGAALCCIHAAARETDAAPSMV